MGTWQGESAKAQPFDRPNPFAAAIRRSSWYPTRIPLRMMSNACAGDALVVVADGRQAVRQRCGPR